MKTPAENKGATMAFNENPATAKLCQALEIDSLDELHPNTREMVTRRLLVFDDTALTHLLGVIHEAKVRYAKREAQ